jgi:transposase
MSALSIRDDIGSQELRRQAWRESDGRVSARLIAIANALEGMDRASAARLAGMDRQTLRDWVHRYNEEGIAGLCNRPAPGRRPKLSEGQMAALKAVVLAGLDPAVDKIVRWRVVDLCRWVEERWGVGYSETGILRVLGSLDLSHRKTRPRHPQSREKAQQAFKGGFAGRLTEIAQAHPEAERFEIWSQSLPRRPPVGLDHRGRMPGTRHRCRLGDAIFRPSGFTTGVCRTARRWSEAASTAGKRWSTTSFTEHNGSRAGAEISTNATCSGGLAH